MKVAVAETSCTPMAATPVRRYCALNRLNRGTRIAKATAASVTAVNRSRMRNWVGAIRLPGHSRWPDSASGETDAVGMRSDDMLDRSIANKWLSSILAIVDRQSNVRIDVNAKEANHRVIRLFRRFHLGGIEARHGGMIRIASRYSFFRGWMSLVVPLPVWVARRFSRWIAS